MNDHVCMKKPCLVCAIEANNWAHADEILLDNNSKIVRETLLSRPANAATANANHQLLIDAFSDENVGMALSANGRILTTNGWATHISKNNFTRQGILFLVDARYHKLAMHSAVNFTPYDNVISVPQCGSICSECNEHPCAKAPKIRVHTQPYPVVILDGIATLRLSVIKEVGDDE